MPSLVSSHSHAIAAAKILLEKGECVAIPTETVYGLAANAYNENAVKKIFTLKNRPFTNPLIIHTDNIEKLSHYATEVPNIIYILAKHFSPGPITFLLPKQKNIPDIVTAALPKVAVRIPDHPLTLSLLSNLDFPLAAPSANKFMQISPTCPTHVINNFPGKNPFILDGGTCKIGIESTIVEYEHKKNILLIHRYGGISPEQIQNLISIPVVPYTGEKKQTSGQHTRHYAPRIPLYYETNIYESIKKLHGKKIALLSFSQSYRHLSNWIKEEIIINDIDSLTVFIQHFYNTFIHWENQNIEAILIERITHKGIGLALHDRLMRARSIL